MKAPLCKINEIPETGVKKIDFFGREALVMKVDGQPKAVLNTCVHLGGPMRREGDKLICEWHGAEFDCDQGRCLKEPAAPDSRLMILPTRIEAGVLTYVYGE